MSWGVDGPFPISDADTWIGAVDGATWTAHGSSLEWSGFNYEFHLYYDEYPWTTPAWTEVTTLGIESFQTRRGVKSWWEGMAAGSASITLVNDARIATLTTGTNLNTKLKLTVDTPSGEHDLFVGWVFDREERFDAEMSTVRLLLQDHIGYTGEAAKEAGSDTDRTTGYKLNALLTVYGNAVIAADLAGITTTDGLTQDGDTPAGNLLDIMNTYVRGELGLLWVDGSGVWQFRERDWWYPTPDPVATIGSLDRGGGGTRTDPAYGDTGFKFPATQTLWRRALDTNSFTVGATTFANLSSESGLRSKTDTWFNTSTSDIAENLGFLVGVVGGENISDKAVEVLIPADLSTDAMEYCAQADTADFIEVAAETQQRLRRDWKKAYVMGVSHRFDPYSGWWCTLDADPNLAIWSDIPVPTGD